MSRSITFLVEGDVDTRVTISELDDGTLKFDLLTLGSALIGDLRALFFDLTEPEQDDASYTGTPLDVGSLQTSPAGATDNITDTKFEEGSVDTIGKDANIKGSVSNELGDFDAGVEFGTSGMSRDDIQSASFILSSSATDLSLDMLDVTDFALRYTSVGEEGGNRSGSLKVGDQSNGVADNDSFAVNENEVGSIDLLLNDTNGASNTLTAAFDGDGAFVALTGGGFERTFVAGHPVLGDIVLGTLTVSPDGIATFDANGVDVDALAVGESRQLDFSYTTTGPDGTSLATADVSLTVNGVNDVPSISVEAGDSASESIAETDAPLSISRTLTLTDPDVTDIVGVASVSLSTSGFDTAPPAPSNADLLAMMSVPFSPVLDATEQSDFFTWSFDSGTTTFDYLGAGESLTLNYFLRATDDNGTSDDQTVTVAIIGSNDRPEAQNVYASLGEDDASVTGVFVANDLDVTDLLSFSILSDPIYSHPDLGDFQLGSVTNNGDGGFTFYTGDQFQFLEENESIELTFEYVAIDDSGVGTSPSAPDESDTSELRTATITVNGAYDAPVMTAREVLFSDTDLNLWGGDSSATLVEEFFLGVDVNPPQSTTTILEGFTIIPDVIPGEASSEVSVPTLQIVQDTDIEVGLKALFGMTAGFINSDLAYDVSFTTPAQVLAGDTVTVSSAASMLTSSVTDTELGFDVIGPQIQFALDLIADIYADLDFKAGSSTTNLFGFSIDNTYVVDDSTDLFDGRKRGSELIGFDSTEDASLSFGSGVTAGVADVTLSVPDLSTTASTIDATAETVSSSVSDEFLAVDFDIDALISVFVPAFKALNPSVSVSALGFTGSASLDIADFDIEPALSLIQDISMITDALMFDLFVVNDGNSQVADDVTIGTDVTFVVPDISGDLAMNAVLDLGATIDSSLSLGFDADFVMEFLSASFGLSFAGYDIASESFGPAYSSTTPLVSTQFDPIYDDDFQMDFASESFDFGLDVA